MRQLLAATAFLAIALPLSADKKNALRKLNGTYRVTLVLLEGKPDDAKKDEKVTFVIKDGTILIKEGKKEEKAKFTLDATKKPAQIDVKPDDGTDTLLGIYELKETDKGTELTISFVEGKGEHPKDFKGEGKDVVVVKLFRKKE